MHLKLCLFFHLTKIEMAYAPLLQIFAANTTSIVKMNRATKKQVFSRYNREFEFFFREKTVKINSKRYSRK